MKQGSEQWHKARENKVSGSRIASILGRGFNTREQVMQEFIDTYRSIPKKPVSEFTQGIFDYGHDNEGNARVAYEKQTGNVVRLDAFKQHPDFDWIGVSPDGLVLEGSKLERGFEAKCPWSKKIPKEPDQKYIDQCQLSMEVYNVDRWDLFYWSPDETALFELERDPLWWDNALLNATQFYEEYLQRRDGTVTGYETLTEEYGYLDRELKILKKRQDEIKKVLISACDAEMNTDFGDILASHVTRKGTLDYSRMIKDYSIEEEKYRKAETNYIKLTVKKDK